MRGILATMAPSAVLAVLLASCAAAPTEIQAEDAGDPVPDETPDEISDELAEEPQPVVVAVAKVAPLADLVGQVGGQRVEVAPLIPPGADSHTFEPRPGDARALSSADVFFANGLELNDALVRLAEANLPEGSPVARLAEAVVNDDEVVYDHVHDHSHAHDHDHDHDHDHSHDEAGPNPHLWMSVDFAIRYVEEIADVLAHVDPDGADYYRDNAERYVTDLERLDAAIEAAVSSIPEASRKLVTYHDAWSYFGRRYGIEVVAAVQPADFSEPSAAEVRRIIDQIRALGIPAVFGSEVFPSDVLEVIAEETGAEYVADLHDDELPGPPGDPEHSYIGMMVRNVRLIVAALGGDPALLDPVDPALP